MAWATGGAGRTSKTPPTTRACSPGSRAARACTTTTTRSRARRSSACAARSSIPRGSRSACWPRSSWWPSWARRSRRGRRARPAMAPPPRELALELSARERFEMVELRSRFSSEHDESLASYPRCLYWSAHTTAGFLDRSLIARLGPGRVTTYIETLRRIFPEGAGYAHDRLERRKDLDAAQRAVEPRNGDSHLAFIAGGLQPCVTHPNRKGESVYFVDLDGVNDGRPRRRQTRVIGYHREAIAGHLRLKVPFEGHPIDSINLKAPSLGLYEELAEFVARADVDDRKSTRLNSSHVAISYAVFCLKKK